MKKITIILSVIFLIYACSSSKKAQTAISSGNYDSAIQLTVKKLRKNKTKKKSQELIVLLEDAYAKANEQDKRRLESFTQSANSTKVKSVYYTYLSMDRRQDLVRYLLPLHIQEEGRDAEFKFENYTTRLENAKIDLSEYLYNNAKNLLVLNNKQDARRAHKQFTELNNLNPGYKEVRKLLKSAHFKGTNFIDVYVGNATNQVLPKRLEDDLMNFSAFGVDNFWTVYHSDKDPNVNYDYELELLFKQIDVSPEKLKEKESRFTREIKDGFEYVLDRKGNVATDSLGNSMKRDKYITVAADYVLIRQEKASHILATVNLLDLRNHQIVNTFPIESEFVFIHESAKMRGDIRALEVDEQKMLKRKVIPFPSSEQMIFDTGEDIKAKFKHIIQGLKI